MRQPEVEQRAAQPYVGIRVYVTMEGFRAAIDTGFPEIFGWLDEHGVARAGPPFIRYLVIDMEAQLEVELAVPEEATWRETAAASALTSSRPAGT